MAGKKSVSDHERELLHRFEDMVVGLRAQLDACDDIDVVVGISTLSEGVVRGNVLATVSAGLERMALAQKSLILFIGRHHDATPVSDLLPEGPRVIELPVDVHLHGRGWQARTFMEAASHLGAALLLMPAGLRPQRGGAVVAGHGFSPLWVNQMLEPVLNFSQDLALARFCRHPLSHPIDSHILWPLIKGVLGWHIRQPGTSVFALSQQMCRECLADTGPWANDVGEYGFGPWLILRALSRSRALCEVPLGITLEPQRTEGRKRAFRQMVHVLFGEFARTEGSWIERPDRVVRPAVFGSEFDLEPGAYVVDAAQLARRFKLEFDHYDDTLYPQILRPDLRERIEATTASGAAGVRLEAREWMELLNDFLLVYRFDPRFAPDDVVDALFPFLLARFHTFAAEADRIDGAVRKSRKLGRELGAMVARHEGEQVLTLQSNEFVSHWPALQKRWRERQHETAPYLPRLGAWEFVPNVGVIVPQELEGPGEHSAWAYQVYTEIIDRYRSEYTEFVKEELDISDPTDSAAVLDHVADFMDRLEHAIATSIFPYDIATVDGARELAALLCDRLAVGNSFHLRDDAAEKVLQQAPPQQLILHTGARNVRELLEKFSPREALAITAWTDQQGYLSRVLDVLERHAEPGWFEDSPVDSLILDRDWLPGATELNGTAALTRLAGRVVYLNASPQAGGAYPVLWFVLRVIKSIVGIELFSELWRNFAAEKNGFRELLVRSIRGHWGRRVLSAHNAFENRHQRILVERLQRFARELSREGGSRKQAARLLSAALEVYNLSITLPDSTFVPLSAWTWASYSNRGGVGTPTPLSSLVERDWATSDFFGTYLERAGLGDQEAIDRKVTELIRDGRESDDLRTHMLGVSADPDRLVVQQTPRYVPPPARPLSRPLDGPLLSPTENSWESSYVLNAAAVRLDGTVYILYRAFGTDEVSRIGLAWTKDGIHIDGRLDEPIFVPADPTETAGVEDPRTVVIDGRLYMLYTAWDHTVAQIAMASIPVDAFLERRFDQWQRHGLAYPRLANKDAILYPEKIDGRYVVYHRIDPNMWVSYIDDLNCPWPRDNQQIFAGPRPGMMWDGVKVGAGGPPLKTTHGWLNIYHGVDYERSYRLGVLFMALDDPSRVLYRSPNPILSPETDYELGHTSSWVPHVVFTCGAVPAQDKEVIGPDDEILVYYGAADTVIGVARGRLRDIVPVIDDL